MNAIRRRFEDRISTDRDTARRDPSADDLTHTLTETSDGFRSLAHVDECELISLRQLRRPSEKVATLSNFI